MVCILWSFDDKPEAELLYGVASVPDKLNSLVDCCRCTCECRNCHIWHMCWRCAEHYVKNEVS